MNARALAARTAGAPSCARRGADVRAMIGRFQPSHRARLMRLAASHRYVEDLLFTFPGLIHVLCASELSEEVRADALHRVMSGASLAEVARYLGVPMWLRKLPPEAFQVPFRVLPDTPAFAFRIANALPADTKDAAGWLAAVGAAHRACNEDFALWVAREYAEFDTADMLAIVPVMGLFAWVSMRGDIEPALLMRRPWSFDLGGTEACGALSAWLTSLEIPLYRNLREARVAHINPEPVVKGITFVQLKTLRDLEEEGAAMNNCVAGYGRVLARACSVLYSLREGTQRVATLQVAFAAHRTRAPAILQLHGTGNSKAPHHVWQAVHTWLAGWDEVPDNVTRCGCVTGADKRTWQRFWKPYWLDKGVPEFLPMRAPADPFHNEQRALDQFLRR